jgi:hypothetical protein
MTLRGSDKRDKLANKQLSAVGAAYEPYFLEELDPAIPWLAKNNTKICVNAGASDVQGLALAVKKLIHKHGVELKVGFVDGDDVTDAALELYRKGENFPNLPAGKNIQDWGHEPICAQCYLGGTGIAACFAGTLFDTLKSGDKDSDLAQVVLISCSADVSQMRRLQLVLLCGGMVGRERTTIRSSLGL